MPPFRFIQVGTGGMGRSWCEHALGPNIRDGLIEPVAAVDIVPEVLVHARDGLGLPAARCYTDLERAFAENEADFCTVVVPPAAHESVVDMAVRHGVHILSEKPIADTMEASCRIVRKVEAAGLKMGVTMSHRFRRDITSLRKLLWSREYGDLDYLACRFTCANRRMGQWGAFRYRISDPLMIEGSVHHLDLLADLASMGDGSLCTSIYAQTWNPRWSEFQGDAQALVTMRMSNGRRIGYEGAKANAAGLNGWRQESIRAECERATLSMNHGRIDMLPLDHQAGPNEVGASMPLLEQAKWSNEWLIEQFAHWLAGGPPMETHVQANLQSVALIFAAIESSRTGQVVDVQAFLQRHLSAAP